MTTVLVALQVLLGCFLIILILMHDGKDAGLSGAFNVGGGGSSQVMQRNLTRLTVTVAILFVILSVLLGFRHDL
jgi:preprotein translocase subunit SecG